MRLIIVEAEKVEHMVDIFDRIDMPIDIHIIILCDDLTSQRQVVTEDYS